MMGKKRPLPLQLSASDDHDGVEPPGPIPADPVPVIVVSDSDSDDHDDDDHDDHRKRPRRTSEGPDYDDPAKAREREAMPNGSGSGNGNGNGGVIAPTTTKNEKNNKNNNNDDYYDDLVEDIEDFDDDDLDGFDIDVAETEVEVTSEKEKEEEKKMEKAEARRESSSTSVATVTPDATIIALDSHAHDQPTSPILIDDDDDNDDSDSQMPLLPSQPLPMSPPPHANNNNNNNNNDVTMVVFVNDEHTQQTQMNLAEEPPPALASAEESSAAFPGCWGRLIRHDGTVFNLTKERMVFGRHHRKCDFRIEHSQVSNTHCTLYHDAQQKTAFIEDTSTNGTYMNHNKLSRNVKMPLIRNSTISFAVDVYSEEHKDLFFTYFDVAEARNVPPWKNDDGMAAIERTYIITETVLGKGNFASVNLAINKLTAQRLAVKIIEKSRLRTRNHHENLKSEITILKKIQHPCIVQIMDVQDTSRHVFLFLELVNDGELFRKINESSALEEDDARMYFCQMLLALDYLHDRKITHRDLKPENILLEEKNDGFSQIKITDFGLAKIMDTSLMQTLCGTYNYLAPEVMRHQRYDISVDCWSLGVILFTMLSGALPFQGDDVAQLEQDIFRGELKFPNEDWAQVTGEAKQLVRSLITVDPKQRMSVKQALLHPWVHMKGALQRVRERLASDAASLTTNLKT